MNVYRLIRPLLYQFDAESTHDRVLSGLGHLSKARWALECVKRLERYDDPRLAVTLFGQALSSPIAVAAGLDKNGVALPALAAFGFAYVEVGTVTPRPQEGNERPRVFRLPLDRAIINRMGFPSQGMEAVAENLGRLGVGAGFALNVGPNKDRVEHAAEDCLAVIRRLSEFNPIYAVINVSSPNTARLRQLQGRSVLQRLVAEVLEGRPERAERTPLLIKIAPDLTDEELDDILQVATDAGLQGIVATNTTVSRQEGLHGHAAGEQGGLSGQPLRERSTRMIARIHELTGGALTVVAVGGVFDGDDAMDKIGAGATVVQTYTGMIYEGPGMAKRIKRRMAALLDAEGVPSLADIRGTGYRAPRRQAMPAGDSPRHDEKALR